MQRNSPNQRTIRARSDPCRSRRPELAAVRLTVRLGRSRRSISDAARAAARAGVRTLVLTHPVPPPAPGTEQEWIAEAAAHFVGEVILAHDLLEVTA